MIGNSSSRKRQSKDKIPDWIFQSSSSNNNRQNLKITTQNIEGNNIIQQKDTQQCIMKDQKAFLHNKKFSPEQIQNLKACFQKFSTTKIVKKPPRSRLNSSGVREVVYLQPEINVSLSQQQLGELFAAAEIPLHKQTLNHVYKQLTKNSTQGVSFQSLLQILNDDIGNKQTEEDYKQIFDIYDMQKRGFFDYRNYKYVCEGIAKDLNQAQIHQAFKHIDYDNSGKITFDKFVKIMKGCN